MKTPRFWSAPNVISTALLTASALYGLGNALDRRFTRAQRATLPVIAIGNVTAGGAGKTPTALALAALLQQHGLTPHFISRGYGGSARHARAVAATDDWRDVGDEALLLAACAPTWVAPKRLDAAALAVQHGASLAIADDALQHYALAPDVSLLVIDGPYGIGNGRLLPAGPLRERLDSALARCDAVVMIGPDSQRLSPRITKPIFRANLMPIIDPQMLREKRWLAFAGIGRPDKFYALLREAGATLAATRDFADHHPYSTADLDQLLAEAARLDASLITTAKDAVKIPAQYRAEVTILPVALHFEDADSLLKLDAFRQLMQVT
ncbi:MAG: tetraacyldisaccharide 4'-kinase [Rickettsiales bacterium]